MTLPSSGPISLSDIAAELGISTAGGFSFTAHEAALRELAQVPSGPLMFSDFYGKSQLVATLVGASFDRTSPGQTGSVNIIMSPGNGYLTVVGDAAVTSTHISVITGPDDGSTQISGQGTQWPNIEMIADLDAGPQRWQLQIQVNYAGGFVLSNVADFFINWHS